MSTLGGSANLELEASGSGCLLRGECDDAADLEPSKVNVETSFS